MTFRTGSYVNFAYVIYWDELYSYMLGCLVFLAMLKLLRLLKFNQKVTELISTLQVSNATLHKKSGTIMQGQSKRE